MCPTIRYAIFTGFLCAGAANLHASDLEFRLEVSKPVYQEGEAVLLRTIYGSRGRPVKLNEPAFSTHTGTFRLDIRRDSGLDWEAEQSAKGFVICSPSGSEVGPRAIFALPGLLKAGEILQRVDTRVMEKGRYRAKTLLLGRDGSRHETNEVSFEVKPIAKDDPITWVVEASRLWTLGCLAVGGHYSRGYEHAYAGLRHQMGSEELHQLAPQIIEDCTGSPFRELVLYAYIIDRERARHILVEPMEDPEVEALALQFLAEYPDSWLRPEIQLILYRMYQAQKNIPAAMQMGRDMFLSELQPTELRAWRGEWERMEAEETSGGKAGH